ncbi:MAG: hypothetical protein IPL32_10435 [Chloracidobacterium sp.]|nr:hypothetical protein [Chloracidobacterium sp.]
MRLIVAAVLAGIVMFIWGALSHMVFGIADAGVRPMPNEAAMTTAMKANLSEPGFYVMPGFDRKTATEAEQAAWDAKYKEGPTAVVIYNPTGDEAFSFKRFAVELSSNIAAALVVGMILSLAVVGFSRGVTIATLVGLSGWLSINVSYWNWYRFPTNFVTAELIDQIVGWLLAGFVLGFILKKKP